MLGKFDIQDKMTKMIILLASSALLVLLLKNNEKVLTTKLTNSLLLIVVLGTLFIGYLINEETDNEKLIHENDPYFSDSISDLSLTNSTIAESFENPSLSQIPYTTESDNNSEVENPSPSQIPYTTESDNNSEVETTSNNGSVAESSISVSPSSIGDGDGNYATVDLSDEPKKLPESCFPKDILSSSELLPKDSDTAWAENVPAGQGELKDQNFLNAGYHIGVNTVGQSLRNANRQLRSDPPCPQVKVSPWLQSTIEPDVNRRALEIK